MDNRKDEQKVEGQRKLTPMRTLPVYHEFKKFRKYMFVAIEKMPKWLKHSAGRDCEACISLCVRCLSVFSRTYDKGEKVRALESFLTEWDAMSDLISLFAEVQGLSNHQREVIYVMRDKIEGQVTALLSWSMTVASGQDQSV